MEIKDQIMNFKTMVNSYKLTNLIIAATDIGIFKYLTDKPKGIDEISCNLNVLNERIEPLLNALVFYEIISKNEKGYFLDKYKDILEENSKYNQSGYVDFAKTMMKKYQYLENSVKKEDLPINNFKELTDKEAEHFMNGMAVNAIPQAEYISENFDFNNRSILDIGAGAGTYLIRVANKQSNVTGKMIDLPVISKIQNNNIKNNGLDKAIVSVPCDYNSDFPNEEFDDIFLFAVIHQEPIENVDKLLKKIYSHLKPNGRLFLTSFFLNDDKISPEFSVQFALEMLVSSKNGKVYTHLEITELLRKNGFESIERIDNIPSPATLYVAKKNWGKNSYGNIRFF